VTAVPSVIGRRLAQAREILERAGVAVVAVEETRPPRAPLEGPRRVVRQRRTDEGLSLVVAASLTLPERNEEND